MTHVNLNGMSYPVGLLPTQRQINEAGALASESIRRWHLRGEEE